MRRLCAQCSDFWQKSLNLSETNLIPVSDIIFQGKSYSANMDLHAIRLSAHKLSAHITVENLLK